MSINSDTPKNPVEAIANKASGASKRFVEKSMDISDFICDEMARKGINQKELASLMGKRPSEISKWLTGQHNLTIRTITSLEAALGVDIIQVPDGPASETPSVELDDLYTEEKTSLTYKVLKTKTSQPLSGEFNFMYHMA